MLRALFGLAAALILLLAAGMGLFRLATKTVPGYRSTVERWASHQVGFPMKIGTLSARWHGFGPELVFHSVALESLDQKRVLAHAQTVDVRLSLPTLLEHLRILPSGVVIRGVHLAFSENAKGRLMLPGWMHRTHATRTPGALLAILVDDLHFELRNVVLTLNRSHSGGGPVTVTLARLSLRADDDRYHLRMMARVHPGIPGGLTLTAQARGTRRMPEQWRWQARLALTPVHVAALRLLPASFPVNPGTRARLLARFSGVGFRLEQVRGRISIQNLFAKPTPAAPVTGYSRIAAHFIFDLMHHSVEFLPLAFAQPGQPTIRETFTLGWSGPLRAPTGIRIAANHLVLRGLEPLWKWGRLIPSVRSLAHLTGHLDPQGTLQGLDLTFATGSRGIRMVAAVGRFESLGWHPDRPLPGLQGLDGRLTYEAGRGILTFQKSQSVFTAPWIFDHPIHFHFGGSIFREHASGGGFALSGTASRIAVKGLRLALGAFTLVRKHAGSAPILSLSATGRNIKVREAAHDLPFGVFKPKLVHWLRHAFVSGVIPEADFVFQGSPARFPFTRGGGRFRVRFTLRPGEMHIAPGWPDLVIQKATGEFLDAGLAIRVLAGTQAGISLAGDTLVIPDLGKGVLAIHGRFRGSGAELLGYLDSTPLARRWSGLFTKLAITGPLAARLALTLPVKAPARLRIEGVARLFGIRARLARLPAISDLHGTVAFNNLALRAPLLTGQLAGHRITINAWTEALKTHVQFVGALAPKLLGHILTRPLAGRIQGISIWRGVLRYTPSHLAAPIHFALRSDLVGTTLVLPTPLGKASATPTGVDWHARFDPARETWTARGRYGKIVRIRMAGRTRRGQPGLSGLGIVFGPGPMHPPPARGLVVSGRIKTLDLAGWWALGGGGVAAGKMPWRITALTVNHLTGWGQNLPDVTVQAHSTPDATLFSLTGPDLAGSGTLPDPAQRSPLTLDFARIRIDPITHLLRPKSPPPDPGRIPALNLTSAQTDYGRMQLGRVTIALRHGGPHTLIVPALSIVSPDLDLAGTGRWSQVSGHSQVTLSLKITSHHLGHALQHLALTRLMTARRSVVTIAFHWHGLPWHPEPATLGGRIRFSFKNGRVLAMKPGGAGRFIALFSLNALPRRLGLDFSDVFSRGLAYDRLTGQFRVRRGVATTHNVELFGSSIALWMTGQANLAKRSYDQVALVVPHVGSTLPIAGMIFGGPVGGGIMLALSRIFQGLIENMTEAYYHITGPWSHPVVKRIADDRARALGFVKPHP
ncbi:hypothetical protein B1B_10868 [mine drainage metagenome]|uniref:YhdP central domain-containing protein n=2 Tax=mine drainage metagenome TaxID=410659 RepID=T1BC60_9ZZZZ